MGPRIYREVELCGGSSPSESERIEFEDGSLSQSGRKRHHFVRQATRELVSLVIIFSMPLLICEVYTQCVLFHAAHLCPKLMVLTGAVDGSSFPRSVRKARVLVCLGSNVEGIVVASPIPPRG